ncbi:MAG: hypothetical protein A2X66_02530 [Ignavibacteria bacterium GWA2_54_16]|nr:MAG: hypothetical protein A2X66_02530 [Ignavibacteria bacterium GWA2_54_16]
MNAGHRGYEGTLLLLNAHEFEFKNQHPKIGMIAMADSRYWVPSTPGPIDRVNPHAACFFQNVMRNSARSESLRRAPGARRDSG